MQVSLEYLPWLSERLGGSAYRSRTLKQRIEVASDERVGNLFARLASANEEFRRYVFDPETGCLQDVIVVVLNDRLLDLAGGFEATLADGDRLAVVPALAGG